MRPATVSIIIPTRQMASWMGEAITSALAQQPVDGGAVEVIVVDDGSTDETRQLLDPLRGRLRAIHTAPTGAAAARNIGLVEARGDLVMFLDADDRLTPGAVRRLAAAMDQAAVLTYGEAVSMSATGDVTGRGRPRFGPRPSGDVLYAFVARNAIVSPGTALVRRDALRRAGPFREDLPRAHDWELWCRVAALGPVRYIGGPPLLERRQHDTSISATLGTSMEATQLALDAIWAQPAVRRRFRGLARLQLRRKQQAFAHALVATERLKRRQYAPARRALLHALVRAPAPREAMLLACALAHRLPASIARSLK